MVDLIFKGLVTPTRLAAVTALLALGCDSNLARSTADSSESPKPRETPLPEEEEVVSVPLTPAQYLRQLSLDLRGAPPTAAELDEVLAAGEVPQAKIDEMLKSSQFLDQISVWHEEILWPNLQRYKVQAQPVVALKKWSDDAVDIGAAQYDSVSPDPLLAVDAAAREKYVIGIESEALGKALRGGGHAYNTHNCDLRDEAEYPDPDVAGGPENNYTVPADRSGTGESYTAQYYTEDGEVLPIQDYLHCPNWCRLDSPECPPGTGYAANKDEDGDEQHDCYSFMTAQGDQPGGRHKFDVPNKRCPDGYVRDINPCNFAEVLGDDGKTTRTQAKDAKGRKISFQRQIEGWRWATQYWTNGEKVKVCAVQAQDREYGLHKDDPNEPGKKIKCSTVMKSRGETYLDPSCGCGPNGAYCQASHIEYGTNAETRTEYRLRKALEQEPLQIIRSVVGSDEDYLSILTTTRSFVNGPLAFAFRHQTEVLRGEGPLRISPPGPPNPVWDTIEYDNDSWIETDRPAHHAGILTTLEWLIRFPTYRARISQYRRKFLCSAEFDTAPEPDPKDTNPDIAFRNGCSTCHYRLETDGMYYGRFPDRTGLYLDPEKFPIQIDACRYCAVGAVDDDKISQTGHGQPDACKLGAENPFFPGGKVTDPDLDSTCRNFYGWWDYGEAPPDHAQYAGMLWATLFRDEDMHDRIDEGPAGMVAEDMKGDQLSQCAVQRAWTRLVRRDISEEELAELTDKFVASGRKYRALVREIVTGEAYRSVAR